MSDPDVFHLTTPAAWAEAQRAGVVAPESLAREGFVHCSTQPQLATTIDRHFAHVDHLLLLRLDPARLGDALRWEQSHPGEVFPHVHRAIAVAEVVEVVPWRRPPEASARP